MPRTRGGPHPRRRADRVRVTGHKKVTGNLKAARALARRHDHGGSGGGDGGGAPAGGSGSGADLARRLREAAQVIADQARVNAAWSAKIVPTLKVKGGGTGLYISTSAGPAYPNEIPGVRHPTFGHAPWVTNQHRPFLFPAADERIDEAADKIAQVCDDWAREYGFE